MSDDEEESRNEDCEINFISKEWIWKNTQNISKIQKYSRISRINILVGQAITALQMANGILTEDFWKGVEYLTNRKKNVVKLHRLNLIP